MMFRDQVGMLSGWFKGWNECEQTVALLSLLKRVSTTQARFLQICLEHSLVDCTELHLLEGEANNPAIINQWQHECKDKVISQLLTHLPLLKPGNVDAKVEYMKLLPKILAHSIEHNQHIEESRQLLSYALIHPATSLDDRSALAMWLNHLEDRTSGNFVAQGRCRSDSLDYGQMHYYHQRQNSDDKLNGWPNSRDSGICVSSCGWQEKNAACENGHLNLYSSVPATINAIGTSTSTNVPAWLKSLRLHKYAALFSQMTYDEMMSLNECQLEAQNVTKGARHKIVISIQKLKERHNLLKSLERDILDGGNLRGPLQELHQMILTPIKTYSFQSSTPEDHNRESDSQSAGTEIPGSESKEAASGGIQQHHHLGNCEGETGAVPLSEGDLPGQFTRVMGKVCTQLLVSRPDEENISSYLQLIDKCLIHESFTETQKKRLLSWKQQVQKLFRSFPRKSLMDVTAFRQPRNIDVLIGSRGFGQSNSLPTAGSVGAGIARRNPRPFPIPSRNLPSGRLGMLGPSGLLGTAQRPAASNPPILKQGRQNLWFANPGGSNSMPSRSHSSVQRTRSLPVHTSPQTMLMFQQPDFQIPVTEPDINNRLESLCLSMTEHALGDGVDRTSTI
uniref:Protein Smaug homolog 1 n=1 Tax=Leptobrachium leishanense TaxID=445787 RepID=A0A8C5Q7F8_9ANUR